PVKPGARRRAGKGVEFRHYFNGITAKPETAMDAVLTGYGEEAGRKGQRLLCPGLRGHYPGNALQQSGYRLVRQSVGDGSGGSRQRSGLRPDGRGGWIARLLERVDRQQRQSDQQPERSAGEA